jgi:phospholipase C
MTLAPQAQYTASTKCGSSWTAMRLTDHASINIKFIERNWSLGTISGRGRDNLPNPMASEGNPYVPKNSPAIGDLFDLFNFSQKDHGHKDGGQ